jgi:phospholipid/cholesterol/gamma-HCH transport system ATP-binding protein
MPPATSSNFAITVNDMTIAYGSFVVQRDLTFAIERGDVFIIMGGSGCGKSSIMNAMIGLVRPTKGRVLYAGESFWDVSPERRQSLIRTFGVMYQSGALWSSMTLAQNVALPLEQFTDRTKQEIREIASLKLALVGLGGFEDYFPSEISGGMRKRAAIARAMSLDPEILFLDEPSAGLDPLTSRRLDELILELRDSLQTTFVVVTHELASVFMIGTNSVFLDAETKTMIATGDPNLLRDRCPDERVRTFLRRGETRSVSAEA